MTEKSANFSSAAENADPDVTIKVTDEQRSQTTEQAKEYLQTLRNQNAPEEDDDADISSSHSNISVTSIGGIVRFLHRNFLPDLADRDKSRAEILLDNTRNDLNHKEEDVLYTADDQSIADALPKLQDACEIGKPFAEGGQGIISKAVDKTLRRTIAIKSLRKEILEQPALRKAFITEAMITAQLEHPAIVPIHGLFGDDAHGIHQAMKLVRGHTLKEELQRFIALRKQMGTKISQGVVTRLFNERIELLLKVCEAVSYAHSRNIIHCDLKPENIMIGEYGEVYVMDWGLARRFRDEQGKPIIPPKDAPLDGTPRFMPAETFAGKPRDERTDIFALGLILFEMVTLRRGFTGKTIQEVIRRIKNNERTPIINRFGYSLSKDLVSVIEKATAFEPEDRYQHVSELEKDLRNYLGGLAVSARPENIMERFFRVMRRYSRTLVLLTLCSWAVCAFFITMHLRELNAQAAKALAEERATAELQRQNIAQLELDRHLTAMDAKVIRSAIQLSNRLTEMAGALRQFGEHATRYLAYRNANFLDEEEDILPIRPFRQLSHDVCTFSPIYNDYVKTDSCSYQVPVGSDPERVHFELERLAPLSDDFRNLVLNSTDNSKFLPLPEQERLLVQEGLLLRRVYLGMADTGLHIAYPGGATYPDDYDNRKRSWFLDAKAIADSQHNLAATWSKPYLDVTRKQQVMTCSIPILDKEKRFLGTIAFDLFFEAFTNELRENGNGATAEVIAKYLCTSDGTLLCQVPVRTAASETTSITDMERQLRRPLSFLFRKTKEATTGGYGHFKARENGQEIFYDYAYLPGLKFYLIEKTDADEIEKVMQATKEMAKHATHARGGKRRGKAETQNHPTESN